MSTPPPQFPPLSVQPIGVIRTHMRTKFDSPHQPKNANDERNTIQLYPGRGFETALQDLTRFDRIWLLWWFHRNQTWRPLVLPPRGSATRRGVFATRSPHRPNPIGITAVHLLAVNKLELVVGNTDLVDGTPILDIKPYIASVDAFPDASPGWLVDVEEQLAQPARYTITYTPQAAQQLDWLRYQWGIRFIEKAVLILQRDPSIHRTRRIRRWRHNKLQMGCGAWRIIFSVDDFVVTVDTVTPGYPDSLLLRGSDQDIPDQAAQLAFKSLWPDVTSCSGMEPVAANED